MEQLAGKDFDYYTKVITEAMSGLSLREIGLYVHMKSQSKDWRFNMQYMAEQLGCSVYQVRINIKKLISKGLIERIQTRVKGLLGYVYKVRDKQGEVRDDAYLMHRREEIVTYTEVKLPEIKNTEIKKIAEPMEVEVEEKKQWRELFEGNENLINKFISDRKRWLANCDHYKKLGRLPSELEVENHINRKLNDENSGMETRINEFIANERKREKTKAEVKQQSEITEAKRLEIEMKDIISKEKIALSRKKLPNFWKGQTGFFGLGFFKAKVEAEQSIKDELEKIEAKYQAIYKPLIEKAKNE